MKTNSPMRCVLAAVSFAFIIGSQLQAAIISVLNDDSHAVVDTGSTNLEDDGSTYSFDAGSTADFLVVAFSSEKSGGTPAFSYNGTSLLPAVTTTQSGIWYLANPFTGGAVDIIIDFTGVSVVNGYGLGIASLSVPDGFSIVLDAIDADAGAQTASKTVNVATTLPNAFIMTSMNANGGGAAIDFDDPPLTEIYNAPNIGSAKGAAAYEEGVAPGLHSYTFTSVDGFGDPVARAFTAAAFVAVPEPSTYAVFGLLVGAMGLAVRRKRA